MLNDDDIVLRLGLLYAKKLPQDNPRSLSSLAKALVLVSANLAAQGGHTLKQVEEWVKLGHGVGAAGHGAEVALRAAHTPPQTTREPLPGGQAQELGITILSMLFDAFPDEVLAELPIADLVDGVALAIVHFAKSLDLPLSLIQSRVGAASVIAEEQLAALDRLDEQPLLN